MLPSSNSQSSQEYFRLLLLTVVGQAFGAAGYQMDERPTQWAGGLFRFVKRFKDDTLYAGLYGFIEYQLLDYGNAEGGAPSRFRVTLIRSDKASGAGSKHPDYRRRSLSGLVVEDFDVPILPSADHWWTFRNTEELGNALAESGHLVVGYGLPYLSGDLSPE